MDIKHYPYRFVKKVTEPWDGPQGFMLFKELYSFKSPKSNQTYWVWIEVYKHHFYAVKFHLKAHRDSDKKYNVMTGLNEARECIYTCMAIMNEVAKKIHKLPLGSSVPIELGNQKITPVGSVYIEDIRLHYLVLMSMSI